MPETPILDPMSTEALIAQAYSSATETRRHYQPHEPDMPADCPRGVKSVLLMVDHIVRQRVFEHSLRESHRPPNKKSGKPRKNAKR